MAGLVRFERLAQGARVTLDHPAKFNAMSRSMWRELRAGFAGLSQESGLRWVLLQGQGGHFCAGGDIAEYPEFRFAESSLREFHEGDVWGGLQAILDCPVPVVAAIEGNCMGAGLEIAACCDIRIAAVSSRFGAPIAKLGFPMAPREAALVATQVGETLVRAMLLEAAVYSAPTLEMRGFLTRMVDDDRVLAEAEATVQRIAVLAPDAARLNKRTLSALRAGADAAMLAASTAAYAWAGSQEHHEGVTAFLEKRRPDFSVS